MCNIIVRINVCAAIVGALFFSSFSFALPISRVSVISGGGQSNDRSLDPDISSDGRYVVFHSEATNLVAGDTNGWTDVFVHDRDTKTTERVSVTSGGAQATGNVSQYPSISADGRYVAFESYATNLVANDTNGNPDVFVHDRQTGTTERVSVTSGGVQGNSGSGSPVISADGRYVMFCSYASNLVVGDTNGASDIFRHDLINGTTERVSLTSGGAEAAGGYSGYPAVSADGRYVAFMSEATNLAAGDTNGVFDIFLKDMDTGEVKRVSEATGGLEANDECFYPAISGDGRYVVFKSGATNLVPDDTNGKMDIFIHDAIAHTTERVNVSTAGAQATGGDSSEPTMSHDGRYVVFRSGATNLVPDDTNGTFDIFLRDRIEGTTIRISTDSQDNAGANHSYKPVISGNNQYVAFYSAGATLIPGDTNAREDIFVKNTALAPVPDFATPISRVSVATGGTEATGGLSEAPAVSSDGRFVAFHSAATNLVDGDTNGNGDIFVHDRQNVTTERVSVTSGGAQATGGQSRFPAITPDGRYVAFQSEATNLVAGDTNGWGDIFIHDRWNGTTERVSVATGGTQATSVSTSAAISDDGRYVVFQSFAPNLVDGDTNGKYDIFRRDLVSGTTELVSASAAGVIGNNGGSSTAPKISADGRYVVFRSGATNLVANDTNGADDIFLKDMDTGKVTRVSVSSGGLEANDTSDEPAISADGRYVAFASIATNLVTGDTNGRSDIFIHDMITRETERVNVSTAGAEATGGSSEAPSLSPYGRYVVFMSDATNLVEKDTNDASDIFIRDRIEGTTHRVSTDAGGNEGFNNSYGAAMTDDARYVAFSSFSDNFVFGDTNANFDVFFKTINLAPPVPPAPPAPTIPTMTEWGMIVMAALIAVTALVMRRRQTV